MFTTIQNIKGRIGNQMFEVANAYAYSKRYNRNIVLNIPQERDTYYKKYGWITERFNCNNTIDSYEIWNEPTDGSYKQIENINNNLFVDGYFQDTRYFEDYIDDIKQLFKCEVNIHKNILNKYPDICNYVGIHIRRGDYLLPQNKNIFYIPEIEWYEYMYKLYFYQFTPIIFSDDIEWCKNNVHINNAIFSEFDDEILDFYALSLCKHHICSNSTFSWWACYLTPEQNESINFFPVHWFTPESGLKNNLTIKLSDSPILPAAFTY